MPDIKMIANRLLYRGDDGKEYKPGESFSVKSESEVSRLERTKRARRDTSPVAPKAVHRPPVETRPAVVETKVLMSADEPASEPITPMADPETSGRRSSRYRRSDLRSED